MELSAKASTKIMIKRIAIVTHLTSCYFLALGEVTLVLGRNLSFSVRNSD